MGLFQLANTHTFGQLVTAIAGLIGISNYLTDGPSLVANTELILTKPGTTLNVTTEMVVGNTITLNTLNVPQISTANLSVTKNVSAANLTGHGRTPAFTGGFYLNVPQAFFSNAQIADGFFQCTTAIANTVNITSVAIMSNLTVDGNGSLTFSSLYTNTVNILNGTMNVSTSHVNTAIIQNLQTAGNNSGLILSLFEGGLVSNSIFNTPTFLEPNGLHKANVSLGNVDNTSDATKNSATANLSNKTLMSPLIVTGNVSEHPNTSMQIATEFYANVTQLIHNPIINGRMDIWQRGNTSSLTQGGFFYQADRWFWIAQSTNFGDEPQVYIRQSNNVPTFANSNTSLTSSLEVNIDAGMIAPSTDDLYAICQKIEGYNWRLLDGKPLTLSFWVRSHLVGTYAVALELGTGKVFTREYTISSNNSWEYKEVRFDAPTIDAANTNYTTGVGAMLGFALHSGSLHEVTPNSWITNGTLFKFSTANQVNAVNNSGASWFLTDVKLYTGDYGLPLGPYYIYNTVSRSLQMELDLCKRYYQKSFYLETKPAANTGVNTGEHRFTTFKSGVVTMNSPTVILPISLRTKSTTRTLYNPANTNNQVRDVTNNVDCSGSGLSTWSTDTLTIATAGHGSTTVGDQLAVHWTVDNEL